MKTEAIASVAPQVTVMSLFGSTSMLYHFRYFSEIALRMTDAQWWEANGPLLEKVFDGNRFPIAARVGAAAGETYGAASAPVHAFEFGLARILDGIEVLISERAGRPG